VVEATWASLETGPQISVEKCTRNYKVLENTTTHSLNGIILFIVFSKKSVTAQIFYNGCNPNVIIGNN